MFRLFWIALTGGAAALTLILVAARPRPAALALEIRPSRLPADGFSTASLVLRGYAPHPDFTLVQGQHCARLEGSELVAGVLPGSVVVEARVPGFAPARAILTTTPVLSDRAADGTPDFLRLDDPADRRAFTRWLTFLAEAQFYARQLPPEINDCAALIRFAYREALREHDGAWASALGLPIIPPTPAVRKYNYPFTPLGARLFRIAPGSFVPADLTAAAFAEFADAQSLVRRNAHFLSRDLRRAAPGDLLFFQQLEQSQPFHTMIFLGPSQFEPGPADFVVYHTGPIGRGPGEIRRPTVAELLRHPAPRWRPTPGNPNFLGVYRWNILRETQ